MSAIATPRDTLPSACRVCVTAVLLLSCNLPAYADLEVNRFWLNAGFYSAHLDTQIGLRNANPGLGGEYKLNDTWALTAGHFINSDNAHSNYIGTYWQPWAFANAKWGVVGGIFNGYPKAFHGGWFPALIPVVSWESSHVGLNMALVPPLQNRLYGAVSFQLKYRFQSSN